MNDMERLVNPTKKDAKCWRYDTSHGATFGDEVFNTPIGGKETDFWLGKRYELSWQKYGGFWFMEVEDQVKCNLTRRSFGRKLRCAPFAPHSLVVMRPISNIPEFKAVSTTI